MGSSSQQTQSQTQTSPWAPQAGYLTNAFAGAQNALNTAQANATSSNYGAPTQFTAGMTPQQLQAFQSEVSYGLNPNTPNTEQSLGQSFTQEGLGATQGALAGLNAFNPNNYFNVNSAIAGGNAYANGANIPAQVQAAMTQANQEANEVQLPGMASASQVAGNGANNSRAALSQGIVQQGLAEQAAGLSANLQGQYYNTGAGMASQQGETAAGQALTGLGQQAQYGGSYGTLGLGALGQSIQDQCNLYNIAASGGGGLQQANQLPMTNQQQAYQFGQTSPFTALQNEYGIVGSNQWGGTSNTNSNTTYSPSLLSQIGQGVGIFGSLFGGGGSGGGGGGGGGGGIPWGSIGSMFGGGGGYGGYSAALGSMGAGIDSSGAIAMLAA
jgi:hypothetical protein